MDNDANEDLIEATIRRVAEARASQASHAPEGSAHISAEAAAEADLDEDPIEATIRRVAAAKAAQDAEVRDVADPVDAAIAHAEAVVEPEPAADAWAEPQETAPPDLSTDGAPSETEPATIEWSAPAATSAASDDAIEAAIRRVQEQQAARAAEAQPADVELSEVATEPTPYRRPRLVEAQPAQLADAAPSTDLDQAVASLERGLRQTNDELAGLASRVDALLPLLERLTAAPSVGEVRPESQTAARPTLVPPPPAPRRDDDWDDAPQLPRIPLGQPPRPAVMRDPSPMTATAEELVEREVVSPPPEVARPAPEPTPIVAERPAPEPPTSKRGFDLLPRTYRITVEDKRRGVDLVPLHRALLGMDGVKDMSLLSYSNGVAIVSVETTNGIEPDALNHAVSRAMAREVTVEVHNETTMVVKLAED